MFVPIIVGIVFLVLVVGGYYAIRKKNNKDINLKK